MNSLDSPTRQSKSLREHLGNAVYAVTFVSAVGACLALGFALSMIVAAARRPTIVAPSHGPPPFRSSQIPRSCPIAAMAEERKHLS
jgi:hypothetical protein